MTIMTSTRRITRPILGAILSVALATSGCDDAGPAGEELPTAIDDPTELPAEDGLGKADGGLTLVAAYYVGTAVIALAIAGYGIYQANHSSQTVLGPSASEDDYYRYRNFVEHSLNRVAHKTSTLPFTEIVNAMDYAQFVNGAEYGYLASETSGLGPMATRFIDQTQDLIRRVYRDPDYGDGCVVATVRHVSGNVHEARVPYTSKFDMVAAATSASIAASARCAASDGEVAEALRDVIPDGSEELTMDTFLGYGWKSAVVLDAYGRACQIPPSLAITRDYSACF